MNDVGTIIKSRRKEFGLTQAQLSKMAEVSINTLTQVERGEGNPTVRSIEDILKILGMKLTAIVEG